MEYTYDFTSVIDRHGKDAIAIDGLGTMPGFSPDPPQDGFDAIPMWVADMNFPTSPAITDAIIERASHPAFGYFAPTPEYYQSIINWQTKHNGITEIRAEHIGYENGVLGGLVSAVNVLCSKGDKILVHSPTYIGFTMSLENNGYRIVHSTLKTDCNGIWRMDFCEMEHIIATENIHAAVFCSPHNPTGRVWEKWEIETAMELFKKYDVFVISDEIWSDLVLNGHRHITTQSVSEDAKMRTVALYAPSKTFNLAGLIGSYHIIYNKWLRDRIIKESSLSHYNDMNVFSMHALIGAYSSRSEIWLSELLATLSRNINWACKFINENFPGVRVSKPEGTYMLFLDCTEWCSDHGRDIDDIEKSCWKVGVALQDGRAFHGPCHLRMNLALPFSRVREAFRRLKEYVFTD